MILLVLLLTVPGPNWTGAVIHHSHAVHQTEEQLNAWTLKRIDALHKSRGFSECGYHFIVKRDGTLEKGRALNKRGAHALTGGDRNATHIGICVVGYDTVTAPQRETVSRILERFGIVHAELRVERHHEECPGEMFPDTFFTSKRFSR